LVHVESVGENDHHQRYDEGAPNDQYHVNNPAKDGSWIEIAIANSRHGDDGQPDGILKG